VPDLEESLRRLRHELEDNDSYGWAYGIEAVDEVLAKLQSKEDKPGVIKVTWEEMWGDHDTASKEIGELEFTTVYGTGMRLYSEQNYTNPLRIVIEVRPKVETRPECKDHTWGQHSYLDPDGCGHCMDCHAEPGMPHYDKTGPHCGHTFGCPGC
jgi:hypothetical protein